MQAEYGLTFSLTFPFGLTFLCSEQPVQLGTSTLFSYIQSTDQPRTHAVFSHLHIFVPVISFL